MKWFLVFLALVAGLSRDFVMFIIYDAAADIGTDSFYSFWLPIFVLALLLSVGSSFAYRVFVRIVVTRVANTIRQRLVRNLLRSHSQFLLIRGHGPMYQIMTTDVTIVSNFSGTILDTLPSIVFLVIALPQIYVMSPMAAVFGLVVMLGGIYAYYYQRKAVEQGANNIRLLEIKYFEHISDLINGFAELKLNAKRRDDFDDHVDETMEKQRDARIFVETRYSLGDVCVQLLKFSLFGAVLFAIPFTEGHGTTRVLQLITILLFCIGPFESIISQYPTLVGSKIAFKRTEELDHALRQYEEVVPMHTEKLAFEDSIKISQAVAHYESADANSFSLGPVDFELKRGEAVFVAGPNGSGKTTFLNVIAGLHEPDEGELLVDGKLLTANEMVSYRSLFASVLFKFHLFGVLYGLKGLPRDDVLAVLKQVGLEGITDISEDAFTRMNLSSGQRRRLGLAVALLEGRDILLLDEFISDQDPERRKWFFEELIPLLKEAGKTLVFTTHNLQWEASCDRLITFSDGMIVSERHFVDGVEVDAEPEPKTEAGGR